MDGASNNHGFMVGIILITPEGRRVSYTLSLDFKTTNNKEEYEAMIIGLNLAKEIKITEIHIYIDSMMVVNQVTMNSKLNACDCLVTYRR